MVKAARINRTPDVNLDCVTSFKSIEQWFDNAQQLLSSHARNLNDGKPFTEKQRQESISQMKLLSTSFDNKGIKFSGLALQYTYYCTKFIKRGLLMYSVLDLMFTDARYKHLGQILIQKRKSGSNLLVTSIGGGPGNDSSSLVLINKRYFYSMPGFIHCDLYDLEKSWKNYLPVLKQIMAPDVIPDFNQCDITKSLIDCSMNKKLNAHIKEYDLFIFSYVCNETSYMSEQRGGIFWKQLAKSAKKGAIFIFADVVGYSQKALSLIEKHMNSIDENQLVFISYNLTNEKIAGKAQVLVMYKK
jgi:hypothetical protein